MVYLVNYATPNFYDSQERLNQSALRYGVDRLLSYRESDLRRTDFYKKNKALLKQPRGAGYWVWKPYWILRAFSKMNHNDVLIYCDSGIEIIQPLDPLIAICCSQNGIMLFQTHDLLNRKYTKKDCFVLMDCDTPKYWNAQQLMASFSLFVKNDRNIAFVKEWLRYCCDERIVSDIPNEYGDNLPDFKDHRHDQSVLSLLAVKHDIEIYRAPCQHGDRYKMKRFRDPKHSSHYYREPYTNSYYGTLLNHHRTKN